MIRRVALAVFLVALAATACGVQPSGVIPGNEAPSGAAVPSASQGSDTIYLISGGTLTPVRRDGQELTGGAAVTALAHGPTPLERAHGLSTEVPASAVPASVLSSPDGTVVQLSAPVSELSILAQRQIVCTLANQSPPGARFILAGGGRTLTAQVCR